MISPSALYVRPDPIKVVRLMRSHGVDAATERYAPHDACAIQKLARAGRALLGLGSLAPTPWRPTYTAGDATVLVEASFALRFTTRGAQAAGFEIWEHEIFAARVLEPPRMILAARLAMAALGARIKRRDLAAVAALAGYRKHETAVAAFSRLALRLVPEQPGASRHVLPEPGGAHAGPGRARPGGRGGRAPRSRPTPQMRIGMARIAPSTEALRVAYGAVPLHRLRYTVVELAAEFLMTPTAMWRLLNSRGLRIRGRSFGLFIPGGNGRCPPCEPIPQAALPPATGRMLADIWHQATLDLDTPEEPARRPAAAAPPTPHHCLNVDGLVLSVQLARRAGIAPDEVISFVRAERVTVA